MITGDLKNKIDTIWDTFHSNGIAEPFTVIQQTTYLIFLKRLDEEQSLKEKKALGADWMNIKSFLPKVKLGDVCSIQIGKTPSRSKP